MDRYAYTEAAYTAEFERRRELNSSVTLPTGLVTVFVGAIFALGNEVQRPSDWRVVWLSITCGAASVLVIGAIFFLVRAYHGYPYRYAPTAGAIETWRDDLITAGKTAKQAEELVTEYLISSYANATQFNALSNDRKSGFAYRATQCVVGCIVALLLSIPPYILLKREHDILKSAKAPTTCQLQLRSSEIARAPATSGSNASASASASDARYSRERGAPRISVVAGKAICSPLA